MPPAKGPRILIVGAGIAGLSAAVHLWNKGYENIIILEASERIGGRINTGAFGRMGSEIVEVGANWIHGGCAANHMFNLANYLKLLPDDPPLLDRMEGFVYSSGRAMDKDLVDQFFEMFSNWESERLPTTSSTSPTISFDQYLREKFSVALPSFPKYQQDDVKCIFNCVMNYCRFHNGGYLDDLPCSTIDGYEEPPGGNVKVPCGLIKVVEGLIQTLPKSIIKLQHEVTKIIWNKADIRVLCSNSREYSIDHVICTVSLGFLKAHAHTMFEPSLPKAKLRSIQNIPFGKVNKVFLHWDVPFWKKGLGGIKLGWTDEEAVVKSKDQWYKKIFAFDEVLNNPNVLVAWISGDEAEYMENIPEVDLIETCIWLIRRFCGDPSIPTPNKVLASRWCTNPYTLGSYSSRSFSTQPEDLEHIEDPLFLDNEPKILFAGESNSLPAYGTMHGARSSGLKEAERLLAHFQLNTTPSNL